jgi:hypothetical protein
MKCLWSFSCAKCFLLRLMPRQNSKSVSSLACGNVEADMSDGVIHQENLHDTLAIRSNYKMYILLMFKTLLSLRFHVKSRHFQRYSNKKHFSLRRLWANGLGTIILQKRNTTNFIKVKCSNVGQPLPTMLCNNIHHC